MPRDKTPSASREQIRKNKANKKGKGEALYTGRGGGRNNLNPGIAARGGRPLFVNA